MCNFEAQVAVVTDLVLESLRVGLGPGPGFKFHKPVDSDTAVTPGGLEGGQGPSRRPGCTTSMRPEHAREFTSRSLGLPVGSLPRLTRRSGQVRSDLTSGCQGGGGARDRDTVTAVTPGP